MTGVSPAAGSAHYIQNQTATDQSAGFRIGGNAIFNGGAVGIGTVSPAGLLDINTGAGLIRVRNDMGVAPVLELVGGPVPGALRLRNALEVWPDAGATQPGRLDIRGIGGAPTISLPAAGNAFITSGNVGIGTNNPQQTLHVAGNILATGGATLGPAGTEVKSLRTGSITVGSSPLVLKTVTNAFPTAFSTTPRIVLTIQNEAGTSSGDVYACSLRSITTTNVAINVFRVDSSSGWSQILDVNYVAWEP